MTALQTLKKFFSPIFRHPIDYFWNAVEGAFLAGYMIFSMETTRRILHAIQDKDMEYTKRLLILLFIVTLGVSITRLTFYKTGWIAITGNGGKIYMDYYLQKYLHADGNAVEKIGTGRFISILDNGVYTWLNTLFQITFNGVSNLIFTIYAFVTIFLISIPAGCIALGALVLSSIVATYMNLFITEKRYLRREASREAQHNMAIVLMSKNELLQHQKGYQNLIAKIREYTTRSMTLQNPVNLGFLVMLEIPKVLFVMIRIGVYLYIANLIWVSKASFADLSIFVAIMALAEKATLDMFDLSRNVLKDFSAVSLLWNTFDTLPPIVGYDTGNDFILKNEPIIIRNLVYSYGNSKVFNDLSVSFGYGQKTALVGVSGAGKTTLIKLLAGYLHPESGFISAYGNILSEAALKTYYPHIGYLTQDPSVFDGTIRENLFASTAREITEEQMIQALHDAECEFVFEMEKGLDTAIGERGVRLSGGQKQRIAIAKIFLKNPAIVLLDEPTSALDSFSEEKITLAMHRLFEGRTVIIVAHRLQTVKNADRILVMEYGEIVEDGTHESLIKKGGIYARMLELQSGF